MSRKIKANLSIPEEVEAEIAEAIRTHYGGAEIDPLYFGPISDEWYQIWDWGYVRRMGYEYLSKIVEGTLKNQTNE